MGLARLRGRSPDSPAVPLRRLTALKAADKDKSGSLSLSEVKGFLLKNGQLQSGGKFDTFTEALNVLFGVELDCSDRTVEVHLTRLLEKTDAESRSELVACVCRTTE